MIDADSGVLIGMATTNDEGRFRLRVALDEASAPCAVEVRAPDGASAVADVRGACTTDGTPGDRPDRRDREGSEEDDEEVDDEEEDEEEEDD